LPSCSAPIFLQLYRNEAVSFDAEDIQDRPTSTGHKWRLGTYCEYYMKREYLRPNGLEHRWGARTRVNIPVHVETPASQAADACMKNLSLSGAFINTDRDLRIHALIDVSIELPPSSIRTAVIKAHVVRKIEEGVGIEWSEFAPTIIKDLVRSALRIYP
jgi:hypothetical protein